MFEAVKTETRHVHQYGGLAEIPTNQLWDLYQAVEKAPDHRQVRDQQTTQGLDALVLELGSSERELGSSERELGSSERELGSSERELGSSERELRTSKSPRGAPNRSVGPAGLNSWRFNSLSCCRPNYRPLTQTEGPGSSVDPLPRLRDQVLL
ncbi:hypothetical protein NHX12_028379 [Muraenolepis orangiensis]|uniref:Uncharacterized protein n=1 Tax=Muraenolepis orangiensis TaxID=630683 RepID=A0A9Q0EA35_9TELE|nr:hypothetical protein NHX12_028379 [Muraenolepis orangiensis]